MEITFETHDKFQRKSFADRLTKAITAFYPFADGAYVLSLNAKFGSGKTTFLKMWQQDLIQKGFKVVYLNAWETDFDEDPIIPLTSCLLENIITDSTTEKVKNAFKGILGAAALAGNSFLKNKFGLDPKEFMETVEGDLNAANLQKIGDELYKNYSFKLKLYGQLKDQLSAYVDGLAKKPLVILVDELDRVRPDYSIKFLEAIKHIFSVQGVCFVLAVDREQLEISAKQLYGDMDFDNYYLKFVTREASLTISPNIDRVGFVQQLWSEYFGAEQAQIINFCLNREKKESLQLAIVRVSKIFDLTPRQIQSLFRIFAHFVAVTRENTKIARDSWLEAAYLLIATKFHDKDIYARLGAGSIRAKELEAYLITLPNSNEDANYKRHTVFTALTFNLRADDEDNNNQSAEIVFKYDTPGNMLDEMSSNREAVKMLLQPLGSPGQPLGALREPVKSGFQTIYELLEDWRSFID